MEEKVSFNKSVTSKDVARVAGVSQSTVSRVFNKSEGYGVKPEVRERVIAVAREIGYSPNLVARGMISGKTNVIGLVVGDSLGPFYSRIINEFVEGIQRMGKQCLVFKVPRQGQLRGITERVIQFQVEAVVITASAMTKVMAEAIVDNDIPVLLFNRFIPGVNFNMVYVNPIEGAGLVADYLSEKGHTNIGYIHFKKDTEEEQEKKIGFYSRLREHGIYQIQEEVSGYDYQEGYEAGRRLLTKANPPTAVFCTSDLIAMGTMDVARDELGLRVPEDVAVIGYDDIEMASWKAYSLTTVRQPVEEMIQESIKMLEGLLGDEKEIYVKMLKPELIKRDSV